VFLIATSGSAVIEEVPKLTVGRFANEQLLVPLIVTKNTRGKNRPARTLFRLIEESLQVPGPVEGSSVSSPHERSPTVTAHVVVVSTGVEEMETVI